MLVFLRYNQSSRIALSASRRSTGRLNCGRITPRSPGFRLKPWYNRHIPRLQCWRTSNLLFVWRGALFRPGGGYPVPVENIESYTRAHSGVQRLLKRRVQPCCNFCRPYPLRLPRTGSQFPGWLYGGLKNGKVLENKKKFFSRRNSGTIYGNWARASVWPLFQECLLP